MSNSTSLHLARSLRPQMVILPWIIFSFVVAFNSDDGLAKIALGLLWFIAVYGIAVILNDLADIDIDRANDRQSIPYAVGAVSKQTLLELMVGLSFVATLTSIAIGHNTLLLVVAYIILGWLYSGPANIKGKGYWALILLGICYGLLPWVVGWVASGMRDGIELWILAIASFAYAMGNIALKDFKDEEGDRKGGKNTVLVLYGQRHVKLLNIISAAVAYGVVIGLLVSYQLIGMAILGGVMLVINSLSLIKNDLSNERFRRYYGNISRISFFAFILVSYALLSRS